MSNCFIKIGAFNKSLLLPFLLALIQIILLVFDHFVPEEIHNNILESYSIGLGDIAVIIIPHIKFFSISNQKGKEKCSISRKIFLNYIILFFLFSIETVLKNFFLGIYFGDLKSINKEKVDYLSSAESVEIICITIVSIFLLKYKYFIHHYLSIILFSISSVAYDYITLNYTIYIFLLYYLPNSEFLYAFIAEIISIFVECVYYCFIKYMIDRHYQYFWNIKLSVGIMRIILSSIKFAIFTTEQPDSFMKSFWKIHWSYFKTIPLKIMIPKFIINTIFQFINSVLEILTIFYLSPVYILIANNFSKIYNAIEIISRNEDAYYTVKGFQYIFILFYLLLIFSLLVYLEIFELNFLNLNRNTKRKIQLRSNNDLIETINNDIGEENIEIYRDYTINIANEESEENDDKNPKIELY